MIKKYDIIYYYTEIEEYEKETIKKGCTLESKSFDSDSIETDIETLEETKKIFKDYNISDIEFLEDKNRYAITEYFIVECTYEISNNKEILEDMQIIEISNIIK